jgi:Amt family ammonium transporter
MLGTLILWFGWFGFNGGSALSPDGTYHPAVVAVAVVNTTISGAMSGIVALFTNLIIRERQTGEPHYNLSYAMNGALCGLAAITGR